VRTCAHARCVENNVYVLLSGMCGGLQAPGWAEHHYARSAILTPCDVPFPPRGVAAEAEDNQGALLLADLDLERLRQMNLQGAVRTWEDRRHDLYAVTWREGDQDQRAR
jgi:predicted amidohydrolase